ncbi:MAG: lysine--tRNA ligase [Hyphomicrobiales bacterium]|nr:MAG: lysine--tRNA ligase [Hyphomicrobiales bacterium]
MSTAPHSPEMIEAAKTSKSWAFDEARKLLKRLERMPEKEGPVLFETGYGPSGLPHIGTFGEVARTTMVQHAFSLLSDRPTQLICFSDDMDGLRKVPDNLPNPDLLQANLGKPLTAVPDPFGTHDSFGAHNNARLQAFLDRFGFDYQFKSATACYTSGEFDETLMKVLANYDKVMQIILPTLREERRKTYSPFLPVCPRSGHVLQVAVTATDVAAGTITYNDPETGEAVTVPVTGGACKLQWKADWAMRWTALGVDYEMAGKDLIDSVRQSGRICRAIGGTPPEGFSYELFLDENAEKISKSKGNGITIDEWLRYASPESLALFMYQAPRKAKRLYFDVIPKNVDEYYAHLSNYPGQDEAQKLQNPVWHIHRGAPPLEDVPVSFNMLLNLVSASNSEDASVLWGFISRYAKGATPEDHPQLDELVGYAINYFHDFVKPAKSFRDPTPDERAALEELHARLAELPAGTDGTQIQNLIYEIGKSHGFENLRDWFKALYEVLLGQSQGPRFGNFVELYGIDETRALIAGRLNLG